MRSAPPGCRSNRSARTAEDDDATTWNIDYMYDVGLMIGGGSNNIQKNIIGERGLGLPREPKAPAVTAIGAATIGRG